MSNRDERPGNLLGAFIREQRQLADLSIRRMAELAEISNPYLSQIERGLHEPSVRVLQSIAKALNVSAETLLEQAGLIDRVVSSDGPRSAGPDGDETTVDTELAIRNDPRLTDPQKLALLSVYRSYVAGNDEATG